MPKPMQRLLVLTTALLITVIAAYALHAQNPPGIASRVEGPARVLRDGTWENLRRGYPIESGDRVETGPNGRVVIATRQAQIRIGPSSNVALASLLNQDTRVQVDSGSGWFDVRPEARPYFRARTPTAVASVRGTRFSMIESDEGALSCVCEGSIEVRNLSTGSLTTTEAGFSRTEEATAGSNKDFRPYFRGLKVDYSFREEIEKDERLEYCQSCHRMTDIETDRSPDPTDY